MKLTKKEVEKIDDALAILKPKLKNLLEALPSPSGQKSELNDKFVAKIEKAYLSAEGFIHLLQDANLRDYAACGHDWEDHSGCDCAQPCAHSCSQPGKGV